MQHPNGSTKELILNRVAFDAWERFCLSSRGLVLLFLWAFAEATFFPIAPDALLIPMAAVGRGRYWKILITAVLGTVLGGITIYLFAFLQPRVAEDVLRQLPIIQDFMIRNAMADLDAHGAFAFWTQPWSGVSYKIYAILGGARGLNPFFVIPLSAIARGLRMFSVSALVALIVGRVPRFARDFWIYLLLTFVILFGYVWFTTQIME